MKYCCLGVFGKGYFRLVTNSPTKILVKLGSKNKKHLRGSTEATIHPLDIILSVALWALVSVIAYIARGVLWPPYCLLYVSYIINL